MASGTRELDRAGAPRSVDRSPISQTPDETGYQRRLFVTFVVVAAAFMASSYYAQTRAFAIDSQTEHLVQNGLPSAEQLAEAAVDLRRIDIASDDIDEVVPADRASRKAEISRARKSLDQHVAAYLALPSFEGEDVIQSRLPMTIEAVDHALTQVFTIAESGQDPIAFAASERELRRALGASAESVRELMELNLHGSLVAASKIHELRRTETMVTVIFDAMAAMLAGFAAVVTLRAFRRYVGIAGENRRLLSRRADELERFAQHIAHDLVSPLAALTYRLDKIKRAGGQVAGIGDAVQQAKACVQRAQRLTGGVFEFARSGAVPGPFVRADLESVLADVIDDALASAGDIGAEISSTGSKGWVVACTPGVLTSVLANLLDNAVKHAGDGVPPRVEVSVAAAGSRVRIAVKDHGPGLPPGVEERVFEPYFRADGRTAPGLGLGLATVTRLVEGHGGAVGVSSRVGEGATFWVELPIVEA